MDFIETGTTVTDLAAIEQLLIYFFEQKSPGQQADEQKLDQITVSIHLPLFEIILKHFLWYDRRKRQIDSAHLAYVDMRCITRYTSWLGYTHFVEASVNQ